MFRVESYHRGCEPLARQSRRSQAKTDRRVPQSGIWIVRPRFMLAFFSPFAIALPNGAKNDPPWLAFIFAFLIVGGFAYYFFQNKKGDDGDDE